MAKVLLLDTDTVTFGSLMANGNVYRVPPFQRNYSWREEHWKDLWDDLLAVHAAREKRHYMGALVLQARTEHEFLVVDGQQRIATLSLLAIAVIRLIEEKAGAGEESEANRERAAILRRNFIGDKDPRSLTYSSRLFLNRRNDPFYQDYLSQFRDPPNPRALPSDDRTLWKAFEYFSAQLRGHGEIARSGESLTSFLQETAAGRLLFIRISVEDQLDAYTLFETLNARGVDLTQTDLIKNYLFSRVQTTLDLERLEREWDRILNAVEPERFPEFLRYYLSLWEPKVRSERLFRIIRDRVDRADGAFHLLADLLQYADLYGALSDPGHEMWREDREARGYVAELALFRVRQIYPVLFAAHHAFAWPDFVRVLKLAVVLSFRFNMVSALNTNELEPAYNKAAIAIRTGGIATPKEVFEALHAAYVDDEKFRTDFSLLAVPASGPRKKLVRYILYRLEADASGVVRDHELDSGSLEHVLPENPSDAWRDYFGAPRRETDLVHRLGNVTLLEPGLNRESDRRSFEEKKMIYGRSQYALSRAIASPDWTAAAIAARQEQLAARAVHIWRSDFV